MHAQIPRHPCKNYVFGGIYVLFNRRAALIPRKHWHDRLPIGENNCRGYSKNIDRNQANLFKPLKRNGGVFGDPGTPTGGGQ